MKGLQEKFQILAPAAKENGHEWTSARAARNTGDAGFLHETNREAMGPIGPKFNQLPPGMELDNQLRSRIHQMPMSVAGQTDVSHDTNAEAFDCGYTRRAMLGADDVYTGEHIDHFYGDAVDEDGKTGFVERNNMLDRL
jgi:hypothetical protein